MRVTAGAALQQRSLYVPAGALPSNATVTFSLNASDGKSYGLSSVSVAVAATPLVASIAGGTLISHGAAEALNLDSSESYDPDDDTGAELQYAWACTAAHPVGNASADTGVCPALSAGDEISIVGASWQQAQVQKNTMRSGWQYTFRVAVSTAEGRSATAEIKVAVEEISPPQVSIERVANALKASLASSVSCVPTRRASIMSKHPTIGRRIARSAATTSL